MFKHNDQRGGILVMLAIMIPVIIGILGLVVDGGNLYAAKQRAQTGADAAALAVAHELRIQNTQTYKDAGYEDAALNGFIDGENSKVDIHVPPTSGPHTGKAGCAEVIIRETRPMLFMAALGKSEADVEARAVAGIIPEEACVWTLNPTASKSLWVTGTADVDLKKCGIIVNSDSDTAAVTNGKATVIGGSIGVVGDYQGNGFSPTPQTDLFPSGDPLAKSLIAPTYGSCNHSEQVKVVDSTPQTFDPGVYCGGIYLGAQAVVTFNPGMYVIKGGGLTINAGAKATGSELTFYLTDGSGGLTYAGVNINAGAEVNFSAPTSGPYQGILFYQDPNIKTAGGSDVGGNSNSSFSGTMYFPTTPLSYRGTANEEAQKVILVADTVTFVGNVNMTAPSGGGILVPALASARLME